MVKVEIGKVEATGLLGEVQYKQTVKVFSTRINTNDYLNMKMYKYTRLFSYGISN